MGKHKIYFVTEDKQCELTACDIKSGYQLYCVVLGKDETLFDMATREFAILHGGPSNLEQLVAIERTPNASTVQVINEADGEILQELKVDLFECPYIAVSPSRKEFALISHRYVGGWNQEIRSQRFSPGPDHVFHTRCIEHFPIPSPTFYYWQRELGKQAVGAAVPLGAQSDFPPYLSRCEAARAFRDSSQEKFRQEITLPPRHAHHKARRPFVPDDRYGPGEMRFVDGDRLVYRTMRNAHPDVYIVFDFGLRMRHKEKGG
ncbi:uncharacterized protein LDX57_013037 [Aspergillus melleus]|uniref:uncharacterized protein n=1 Tax=Aspergillus melleus TaxID=138277 RepID=UPI001E8CBEC5|nr:uncharacterized protein LDX57_013037 [Aspergillus melleus]KAH8435407.1 hypothetical protein LDX57_013037 [Aspergillus melleus]